MGPWLMPYLHDTPLGRTGLEDAKLGAVNVPPENQTIHP